MSIFDESGYIIKLGEGKKYPGGMMSSSRKITSKTLHDAAKCLIPSFYGSLHKGQHGKIAVVGGSFEYTGAPYYSAVSALRTGADLSFVICTENAATPIKSYDPELIVLPLLDSTSGEAKADHKSGTDHLLPWIKRMDAIVIGPGLGRDQMTLDTVRHLIQDIQKLDIPMVIDADGLYLLSLHPNLLSTTQAVVTPNSVELARLLKSIDIEENQETTDKDHQRNLSQLSEKYGGASVLQKRQIDTVASSDYTASVLVEGSPRRCGGQGDILSGVIATFLAWAKRTGVSKETKQNVMAAAWAGSAVTRMAARLAFAEHRRSTTTPDMLPRLGKAFEIVFPSSLGFSQNETEEFRDPSKAWLPEEPEADDSS